MHEQLSKASFEEDVQVLTEAWASKAKVKVNSASYPVVDLTFLHSTPLRLRLTCDSWPELPPSVELLDVHGNYLKSEDLPRSSGTIFNGGAHPTTRRPFVCMRGTREFHTHPSHLNERWESYKGQQGMGIVGVALQIAAAWKRTKK